MRLPTPVSLLIAANWDLSGTARVFSRDDATDAWFSATLAQDRSTPGFLPQVRSLDGHRDRVTGIDRIFAGQDPHGIFSGAYDPAVPGRIRWSAVNYERIPLPPQFRRFSIARAGIKVNPPDEARAIHGAILQNKPKPGRAFGG